MNKKLIAAAVSAAVIAPVAAQAESSFYGRVNNAIEIKDDGTDSTTNMADVTGRVGYKGSTDIGNGMTAHGQFEFRAKSDDSTGFRSDDDGNGDNGRIATVGLSGGFGSVTLGQQWSSYFNTFGTLVSPTYSLGFYLFTSAGGGMYRQGNTVKYSNSFGPVSMELDYRADEGNNGLGIGFSISPMENLTIAVAFDNQENSTAAVDAVKGVTEATLATLRTELIADHTAISASNLPEVVDAVAAVTAVPATVTTDEVIGVTAVTGATYYDELVALLPTLTTAITDAKTALAAGTTGFAALHDTVNAATEAKADAEKAIALIDASGAVKGDHVVRAGVTAKAEVPAVTGDDAENTGIAIKYDFGVAAVTLGHQSYEKGDAEADTTFINVGGNISEKTNWLAMYSTSEDQADAESDQILFGLYHNIGGGLTVYYEGTEVDVKGTDTSHHLLGMRINF